MSQGEATLLIRIKQAGQDILDHFVITLGDVIELVKKIPEAVMAAVDAYRQKELAVNQLTQAMIQQGVYTSSLRTDYLNMAEALQELTTYGNEEIVTAEARIQSYIGEKKVTQELLKVTLDFAAANKMDLASAAEIVGKTIGGTTNALSRYKVVLSDNLTTTERYSSVVDQLNKTVGGQAEAAAKGLGGIDQLKNSWTDFLAGVGLLLKPFVEGIIGATGAVLRFFNAFLPAKIDTTTASASQLTAQIQKLGTQIIEIQERTKNTGGLNAGDKALVDSLQKQIDTYKAARLQIMADEQTAADNLTTVKTNSADKDFTILEAKRQEQRTAEMAERQAEFQDIGTFQNDVLNAKISSLDKQIAAEDNYHKKAALMKQKSDLQVKLSDEMIAKNKVALQKDTFSTIATLSSSNNSTLANIGKAAGITQIAIDTPVAISKALAAFPPPFSFIAAGLVATAMAAQAARIAGVKLADGGIVRATPGGVNAVIGEGGQDEAVIPLGSDQAQSRLGGQQVTINFNGPLLGNEGQAMEFARAIDRSLLKLRQTNQSVAFETDLF